MPFKKYFLFCCMLTAVLSCKKIHHTEIHSLSDEQYPDNPDLENRSENYNEINYTNIRFVPEESEFKFSIELVDENNEKHLLVLPNIDLYEFIPTTPPWIRQDEYLTKIGLINQEWNRQQVRFNKKYKGLKVTGNEFEEKSLVRVDIARNCLSSYKWEVILYAEKDGEELPYYHGWFNFPESFYKSLFNAKNDNDFSKYERDLTEWQDPDSEPIKFELLRTVIDTTEVRFNNLNNRLYTIEGERKTKQKNIITPTNYNRIQDFLTDSTTFATFTKEGFYDKNEIRETELGRLAIVDSIWVSKISSPNGLGENLHELRIFYTHNRDSVKTELIIGGINFKELPRLRETEASKGWQNSMGIANHSFYESYEQALANSSDQNPYYALLTDQYQNWLDSHKIGIDGPLLFLDKSNPRILHIFILSFERHAFVGHYTINLNSIKE